MNRLSLYITPGLASITVENGATRETSARTITAVIDAMPSADRDVLLTFCRGVLEYAIDATPVMLDALISSGKR